MSGTIADVAQAAGSVKPPELLVGLVGFNPLSVLVSARALKPQVVALVCTDRTSKVAENLAGLLDARGPTLTVDSWLGIDALRERFARELASAAGHRVVLDVTGATKPLAIAAWQALHDRVGPQMGVVYLETDGTLVEARSGARLAADVRIDTGELLRIYGGRLQSCTWAGDLGEPDAVPAEFRSRSLVGRALLSRARTTAKLCRVKVPGFAASPGTGLRYDGKTAMLSEAGAKDYLAKNQWLEELCLVIAGEVATGVGCVHASLGAHIVTPSGGNDECDVLLTRGARIAVIEAKTADVVGEDLQKRSAKTRRFFGEAARVVVVAPDLNPQAIRTHSELAHRNTEVVGADEGALRAAIRRGLGLPEPAVASAPAA